MEGTLLGVPSIALSQAYGGARGPRQDELGLRGDAGGPTSSTRFCASACPGVLINVNFPACAADEVAGVAVTAQGRRDTELMRIEERRDGRAIPYYWLMFQRGGSRRARAPTSRRSPREQVSVTPLRLDLTDEATRRATPRLSGAA